MRHGQHPPTRRLTPNLHHSRYALTPSRVRARELPNHLIGPLEALTRRGGGTKAPPAGRPDDGGWKTSEPARLSGHSPRVRSWPHWEDSQHERHPAAVARSLASVTLT